jgi:hypothetical protein
MDFVKQKWSVYYPQSPFRFFFLDEQFNAQYKTDKLFATVLWLFTAIAIVSHVLDCLAYHFLQLQKEIRRSVFGKY